MSSEAGSVFPLSRLSVFDFSPLSPTNKAANTTAADTAFFLSAQMWMAPLHQRAPDPNPATPSVAFAKPHTHSPSPTTHVTAHRNIDSYPLILLLYVNPKRLRLPGALCENTHEKYLQMVCVFAKRE